MLNLEGIAKGKGVLQIQNIHGVFLRKIDASEIRQNIDIQELNSGLYYLVYQNEGTQLSAKFI